MLPKLSDHGSVRRLGSGYGYQLQYQRVQPGGLFVWCHAILAPVMPWQLGSWSLQQRSRPARQMQHYEDAR